MKTILVFDFYVTRENINNICNEQHFVCIDCYKEYIDEVQVNIISDIYDESLYAEVQNLFLEKFKECIFSIQFKFMTGDIHIRDTHSFLNDIFENTGTIILFTNNFMAFKPTKDTLEDLLSYIIYSYWGPFSFGYEKECVIRSVYYAYSPIVIGDFDYYDVYTPQHKILYILNNIFLINTSRYLQHFSQWLVENKNIHNIYKYPFYYSPKYRQRPDLFLTKCSYKLAKKYYDKRCLKTIESLIILKKDKESND